MDPNSQNNQLNEVSNNILGLNEDESLLSQNHENFNGAYDRPEKKVKKFSWPIVKRKTKKIPKIGNSWPIDYSFKL